MARLSSVEELGSTLDSMQERVEMLVEVRSMLDALGDEDEEAA